MKILIVNRKFKLNYGAKYLGNDSNWFDEKNTQGFRHNNLIITRYFSWEANGVGGSWPPRTS